MQIGQRLRGRGFRVLAVFALLAAPATAFAHAYIVQPPARDIALAVDLNGKNAIAHKTGPCGGVARKGTPARYDAGATITVQWEETIGHQGCYQVVFSKQNDTNFRPLAQINDPANSQGMQSTTVTLPSEDCPACTLAVYQLMQGGPCAPDANPATAAQGTYYSCADICLGATCDTSDAGSGTDGGGGTDDGGGTSSGGPTTTPTDGGGKTVTDPGSSSGGRLRPAADDGGCSVAFGATSGLGMIVGVGLLGMAVARRRRRR